MKRWIVVLLLLTTELFAQSSIDQQLKSYINNFKLRPLEQQRLGNRALFELGKKLFSEKNLSGTRQVSCASCHATHRRTIDSLPIAIGTNNAVGARNTQALYNVGASQLEFLFWDGRVFYHSKWEEFETPEVALNGAYPAAAEIVEQLGSGLAAQALFPLVAKDEMLGEGNEVARARNNLEAWELLTKRIVADKNYASELLRVYGNQEINIGHIANAIAYFITYEFSRTDTPWDRYLRGNLSAMSVEEKRGAITFLSTGRCIECHTGQMLGGEKFEAVASPQIGPGKDIRHNDEGRFYVTGRDEDRYKFRVPPLRNVALTAPYFHAGAYQTLSDVIEHYRGGFTSIDRYQSEWLNIFNSFYGGRLFVETNHYMIFKKKDQAHTILKNKEIKISESEKADLLKFLDQSLTQL